MTPPKRETAKVQDILNNPVKSNQPALHYKKEGFLGWLSYLGFSMVIVLPSVMVIGQILEHINLKYTDCCHGEGIYFPFCHQKTYLLILAGLGLIFTIFTIFKSPYKMKSHTRIVLSKIFFILWLILEMIILITINYDKIGAALSLSVKLVWLFLLSWYIRYFYKKSKDGYHHVWLKVFIFLIIPFLPLLDYRYYEIRKFI